MRRVSPGVTVIVFTRTHQPAELDGKSIRTPTGSEKCADRQTSVLASDCIQTRDAAGSLCRQTTERDGK
jgi:hypothetical protein